MGWSRRLARSLNRLVAARPLLSAEEAHLQLARPDCVAAGEALSVDVVDVQATKVILRVIPKRPRAD